MSETEKRKFYVEQTMISAPQQGSPKPMQTKLTVSEQSKLDIIKSMLDSGNFSAVITRCRSLLETNETCALAYWYLFLAENECKAREEFENSTNKVDSFESFEFAISYADATLKEDCYRALYNRAKAEKAIYIYDEIASLPNFNSELIKELALRIYDELIKTEINENSCNIFETIIKTVNDMGKYIEMSLNFADKIFNYYKEEALKIYKNVLAVEQTNCHAIWQTFRINHNLNTSTDVAAYLMFKENHGTIEQEAFKYGFNLFAVEQMFAACLDNIQAVPQYNTVRLDYIFSLIPSDQKALYNKYIIEVTNSLLIGRQFSDASRYNDIILFDDKYNDMAYFKRLYIKRKTLNPFDFAENCDSLFDDPDFSAAIDAYAEKHPKEQNIYIELVNSFNSLGEIDSKLKILKELFLNKVGLTKPVSVTVNEPIKKIVETMHDVPKDFTESFIVEAIMQTDGYYFDYDNAIELFSEFLALFSSEDDIIKAKQCYNQKYGAKAFESMAESLKESINKDAGWETYAENHSQITFDGMCVIIANFLGCKTFPTAEDYCLIAHLYMCIETNDEIQALFLLKRIKENKQIGKDLDKIAAKAKGNAYEVFQRLSHFTPSLSLKKKEWRNNNKKQKNYWLTDLTSIVIPDSVTEIPDEAFCGCRRLMHVKIGNGVKTIGSKAFYGCSALTNIDIPNSVTAIGNEAFYGCSALTSVDIPDSVTAIGDGVFCGCKSLKRLTVGNNVKVIGNDAFKGCDRLDIYISDVKSWCNIKFKNDRVPLNCIYLKNEPLTDLIIPNNVERVDAPAFFGLKHIKSIVLQGVKHVGEYAFYECSEVTSISIQEGLITIGERAFQYCEKITSIEVPSTVKSISDWAFLKCTGITTLTIKNGLTTICEHAFHGCEKITSVEIPATVTAIGNGAFSGCTALINVTIPKRFKKDLLRIFDDKQAVKRIKFKFTK